MLFAHLKRHLGSNAQGSAVAGARDELLPATTVQNFTAMRRPIPLCRMIQCRRRRIHTERTGACATFSP